MKKTMLFGVLATLILASGCSTFRPPKTGLFAALQTADEALAVKYGVPVEAVREVRTVLGIPDARALPGPERVLPEGLALQYDWLDASNQVVVDVSLFHRSTVPRIVAAGAVPSSAFDAANQPKAKGPDLEAVVKAVRKAAEGLKP